MIRTFASDATEDIWNGINSKAARRIPKVLDDLRVPPGNRLHALGGDRRGYHAIRVNDQHRIVFRFEGHDAFEIACTDYH